MSRKAANLASLEIVSESQPIPNSRKLAKYKFQNSKCNFITAAGTFNKGQVVLVVRSGAIIPKAFLKHTGSLRLVKKNKVKRLILRGCISDCVAFPIGILPHSDPLNDTGKYIGQDVSAFYGITASEDWYKHHGNTSLITKFLNWFKK